MSVELFHYKQEYLQGLTFELPEEQLQFTSLPRDVLAKCENDPSRKPVVILADDEPVGLFVLHQWEGIQEYGEEEKAVLIRGLSLNPLHQGKGYAKRGMLLLPSFVKREWKHCNELFLVVNERNVTAQKLYLAVGFEDRGKRRQGPVGLQRLLHKKLN